MLDLVHCTRILVRIRKNRVFSFCFIPALASGGEGTDAWSGAHRARALARTRAPSACVQQQSVGALKFQTVGFVAPDSDPLRKFWKRRNVCPGRNCRGVCPDAKRSACATAGQQHHCCFQLKLFATGISSAGRMLPHSYDRANSGWHAGGFRRGSYQEESGHGEDMDKRIAHYSSRPHSTGRGKLRLFLVR